MKWLLSFFGLWRYHEIVAYPGGERVAFGLWLRPWDHEQEARLRAGARALVRHALWPTCHLIDGKTHSTLEDNP